MTGPFDEAIKTARLVDLEKERKAVNKAVVQTQVPIITSAGNDVFLPNYSGIKETALKDKYGWLLNGTSVYYNSGNVGIGTTSPSYKTHLYRNDAVVEPSLTIEQDSTGDATLGFLLTAAQGWTIGVDNSDSDKFKIGTTFSDVGTTPVLTIDNVGFVGVGTTSPQTKFVVSNSGAVGFEVDVTTSADYVQLNSYNRATSAWKNTILQQGGGKVGIGTTSPGYLLQVGATSGAGNGSVWVADNCSALSFTDRTPYPESLAVAYEALESVEGKDGIINKEKLNPILLSSDEKGEKGRNLSMTVSVLLEIIKDLKKRIEVLELK